MDPGKTIHVIAIARVYISDWSLFIVNHCSLRHNWRDKQLLLWLLEHICDDYTRIIKKGKGVHKSLRRVGIVSYDLVTKVTPHHPQRVQFIIADESHYLISSPAQRLKTVVLILKQTRRVLLLSETPDLSRPLELLAQVSAVC